MAMDSSSGSALGACSPEIFEPSLFGAQVLNIDANIVSNHSTPSFDFLPDFCNVSVSYEHPGLSHYITVEVWLPTEAYNGRYLGLGGGAFSPGRGPLFSDNSASALIGGFASATTDAGLQGHEPFAAPWALLSPGNVDLNALQNFGDVSLGEQAIIAKSVVESFYGSPPEFSYWSGCSQGGRQGMALAQLYPDAYDGILANAPIINCVSVLSNMHWPYQAMLNSGVFPHECEFDAIRDAAISACDGLDGVLDGVIEEAEQCKETFDPSTLVGSRVQCSASNGDNTSMPISQEAADIIVSAWNGVETVDGSQVWFGFSPGTDLTSNDPDTQPAAVSLLDTDCSSGRCVGVPSIITGPWMSLFAIRREDTDLSQITHAEFDTLIHYTHRYGSLLDANDPDLSRFRKAGGKLLSAHGMDDELIPYKGTQQYYEAVTARDPSVRDFYRYFETPGWAHCFGGSSSGPGELLNQLMAWVENGTAPEMTSMQVTLPDGEVHERIVCPYPQKARLEVCDDPALAECWACL